MRAKDGSVTMKKLFTFAVCAYRDSPYLEAALESAVHQSIPVEIVVATSTPSPYIAGLAAKYHAGYRVNPRRGGGIAEDWRFALSCAKTRYAAIMHQDDIYFPDYASQVVRAAERFPDTGIVFTDYGDLLSDGKFRPGRGYLWVKRCLLWAFYLKHSHRSRFFKRSALIFGNAVCCPSVTYDLETLGQVEFDPSYGVNTDWAKWLELAEGNARFVMVPKVLMAHRISGDMETAAASADSRRYREDLRIFGEIWGAGFARLLMLVYGLAYRNNRCD